MVGFATRFKTIVGKVSSPKPLELRTLSWPGASGRFGLDSIRDVQVLGPMNRGGLARAAAHALDGLGTAAGRRIQARRTDEGTKPQKEDDEVTTAKAGPTSEFVAGVLLANNSGQVLFIDT